MTEQHRAKPEQWAQVESWTHSPSPSFSCIIELRDRVEALEAAQRVESNYPEKPDSSNAPESSDSLVERVADVIVEGFVPYVTADEPAHAAIHTIADWLDQQELHTAATRLRQEVG